MQLKAEIETPLQAECSSPSHPSSFPYVPHDGLGFFPGVYDDQSIGAWARHLAAAGEALEAGNAGAAVMRGMMSAGWERSG